MTAIDWSAMTPREVYDALRAAPKVAGEWHLSGDYRWQRDDASGDPVAGTALASAGMSRGYWSWHVVGMGSSVWVDARESAMAAADAELVRRGWLLVDDAKGGG